MQSNVYKGALVSVVMATYNGERFIADQIQSLLSQTHRNIELIIQDDQSNDATVKIIESFKHLLNIRLQVNDCRLGFVRNFERAVARAQGEYIALCDQDDIWVETKIETLLSEIGNADLIHSNCELIGENGDAIAARWKAKNRVRNSVEELLFYNDITGCTALFKRHLLEISLPFPAGLAYHDWWFAICAATQNGVKYVDLPLVRYRQHGSQDTGAFVNKDARGFLIWKKLRVFNSLKKKANSMKQLANLQAGHHRISSFVSDASVSEAVQYHRSLLKGSFHWGALSIGIRKPKTLRPGDSFAFLKLINVVIG